MSTRRRPPTGSTRSAPRNHSNIARGRWGEDLAAREYQRDGYTVLDRNSRCELGEVDLILERGGTVVFCEVKTRRTDGRASIFVLTSCRSSVSGSNAMSTRFDESGTPCCGSSCGEARLAGRSARKMVGGAWVVGFSVR